MSKMTYTGRLKSNHGQAASYENEVNYPIYTRLA